MRIFVTGGSGFVGGHVIERLVRSHEVRAMARSDISASIVEAFGATAVRCSLEDITAEHLAGVDAVIHVAAAVDEFAPLAHYEAMNVEGTRRVLEAARAAGVKRVVNIATNATVFDASGQHGVDETAPLTTLKHFHYGTTKAAAEALVLAANDDQMTTLSLRPCFIWGPRDTTLVPALQRMVAEGSFVWVDRGRTRVSTTHIDNLVHAVACALVGGQGGHAYFVADEDETTMRVFMRDLASSVELELPDRSVPGWLVRGLAAALETWWVAAGWSGLPPVTRTAAWLMSADMTVNTSRARAELGWEPVVTREAAVDELAA
ncbi:MAG: NAD-dependent epimerase/dehydratase family protein [Deltaproteobacteria bacterium]|nr:MAG: NAD-dependent epimerase/dehydratase family protein [Deltaproteobacteria bacterium]